MLKIMKNTLMGYMSYKFIGLKFDSPNYWFMRFSKYIVGNGWNGLANG